MTELVGVLNITPDSFSDGGQHATRSAAIQHAVKLYAEGAAIIDVGAESTRPGAKILDYHEEIARLSSFIQHAAANEWSLSIDTYHPETVAWVGKQLSRFIINDVTGFRDPSMRSHAAASGQPIIVSHLPKSSIDIQSAHRDKPVDSVEQVAEELEQSVARLIGAGVAKQNITLDPGIGFGKTVAVNWQLLEFARFRPDYKVMIGYSRKRFLGEYRMELSPNLQAGRIAIASGAAYLRVHDVRGHLTLLT
jgi:dihydropteroate synthase